MNCKTFAKQGFVITYVYVEVQRSCDNAMECSIHPQYLFKIIYAKVLRVMPDIMKETDMTMDNSFLLYRHLVLSSPQRNIELLPGKGQYATTLSVSACREMLSLTRMN